MKNIAKKLPAHTGNDAWEKINDVNWEDWGTIWSDCEEGELADELETQLPDKKKKSNRIDRNIVLTAIKENIAFILHENPKDYNKLLNNKVQFVNLLSLNCLDDFKKSFNKDQGCL